MEKKSKVWITKGSGKMEGINSINTNSLTNEFCMKMSCKENLICSKCYSNRLLKYRKKLEARLESNSKILSERFLHKEELPIINSLYFRFNSYGELINEIHFVNLTSICVKNPKTTFTLWTKRPKLTKSYWIPPNMILIYSNPLIDSFKYNPPIRFDKIFNVYTKEFIEEENIDINCGGKHCLSCLLCYTHNDVNRINEKVK